jgi:hypothetical protein
LDLDALAELVDGGIRRNAFNLNPVGALVAKVRVAEAMFEAAMVRQQQEALTVAIEASNGVDLGHIDEIREGSAGEAIGVCKLTENVEGFVEQEIAMAHA